MGHEELVDFCQKYKRVFCYGAGKYAMTVRAFLAEQKIDLERFIVTTKGQNSVFMGLPVNNVFDVLPVGDDVGIVIGVGETKHDEIKDTLHQYGVNNYFAVDKNCFTDIDQHTQYDKQWHNHDRKVCVLLYHRVCDLPLDVWGLAISPKVFEQHIRFYKENYNILRYDDMEFIDFTTKAERCEKNIQASPEIQMKTLGRHGVVKNGFHLQEIENLTLYPVPVLHGMVNEVPIRSDIAFSIHHYAGTWVPKV